MTKLTSAQGGISEAVRHQRFLLFGNNEIDIEGKSNISLLVDEVSFHPQPTKGLISYSGSRQYTHFMSSKLQALFCGHWTIIITMLFASL